MRSPSLVPDPGSPFPVFFWTGKVLLAKDAGPVLLGTAAEPALSGVSRRTPPRSPGRTGPGCGPRSPRWRAAPGC
ncbi:FtsX-like permease family protein [Streptomyces californicus]